MHKRLPNGIQMQYSKLKMQQNSQNKFDYRWSGFVLNEFSQPRLYILRLTVAFAKNMKLTETIKPNEKDEGKGKCFVERERGTFNLKRKYAFNVIMVWIITCFSISEIAVTVR